MTEQTMTQDEHELTIAALWTEINETDSEALASILLGVEGESAVDTHSFGTWPQFEKSGARATSFVRSVAPEETPVRQTDENGAVFVNAAQCA